MEIQCPHCSHSFCVSLSLLTCTSSYSQPKPSKPSKPYYCFIYIYSNERGKPYSECALDIDTNDYSSTIGEYISCEFNIEHPTITSPPALFTSVRQAEEFVNMLETHKPKERAGTIVEFRDWELKTTGFIMSEEDTMTREEAERFWSNIQMS
jgi:hypothetical protein